MTSFCLILFTTSMPWVHLAEDRVNLVEMRLGGVGDEELAAAGVLAGVGHGEGAGGVLVGVQVGLALDLVARARRCRPGDCGLLGERIAALNHEVGDDPVKPGSIVELAVGQLLEVADGARHFGVEQLGLDGALAGFDGRVLGHGSSSEELAAKCNASPQLYAGTVGSERFQGRAPGRQIVGRLAAGGAGAGITPRAAAAGQHSPERRRESGRSPRPVGDSCTTRRGTKPAERGPVHASAPQDRRRSPTTTRWVAGFSCQSTASR